MGLGRNPPGDQVDGEDRCPGQDEHQIKPGPAPDRHPAAVEQSAFDHFGLAAGLAQSGNADD